MAMKNPFKSSKFVFFFLALGLFVVLFFYLWNSQSTRVAKGDKMYGGIFSYALSEPLTSLFPLETNSLSDLRVISQLFDPLVKQSDSKGTIQNCLAEKIELKDNGKCVYIRLRKGVLFHKDDCFAGESRELTAYDVAFTLSFACSKNKQNQSSNLLVGKIVGSEQFYKNNENPLEKLVIGVQVIHPSLVKIVLTKPYNNIIQLLSHPSLGIISKTACAYYKDAFQKHPVGSGPFYLGSISEKGVKLYRNNDYWSFDELGNQLPFLDEININTQTALSDEYVLFSQKKVDLLFDLPANQLDLAFGTLSEAKKGKNLLHRVHIQKASKINYIGWDVSKPPFNNLYVRQAFELAIDRNRICNEVLSGDGQAITHGFIPTSNFYSNPFLSDVQVDLKTAKNLMQKAGYFPSRSFPKIPFYVNAQLGSTSDLWCRDVCRQLSKIGIQAFVVNVSTKERDQKIINGGALLWKAGWVGDYPDAESYLRLFYHGPNFKENLVKFENQHFDQLYLKSTLTKNAQEKKALQRMCESIVANDCAIIPVYSEDFFVMINLRVRGFEMNSSGIIDFAKIFLKELKNKN
ncbi:MAG: hypothetical protein RLZZ30_25 [Bacteroidota bacterium]|jgi:peptide/nickel transport system substrate-binding protein